MRSLVAHYDLGRGKLYRRTDKRVQTRNHLTSATTMYRDMGVTGGDGDDKSLVIRPGSETGSSFSTPVAAQFPTVRNAPLERADIARGWVMESREKRCEDNDFGLGTLRALAISDPLNWSPAFCVIGADDKR